VLGSRLALPLMHPLPLIAMRVLVSRCILFCVFPRGPIIKPMKLYPGCSFSGTKILRFFFVGRLVRRKRKRQSVVTFVTRIPQTVRL